jgi:hypothetical protein
MRVALGVLEQIVCAFVCTSITLVIIIHTLWLIS